jgi:hypothetical protein
VVASAVVGEVTSLIPGPGTPNGSVGLVSNVATFPTYRGGLAGLVTDDLQASSSSSLVEAECWIWVRNS